MDSSDSEDNNIVRYGTPLEPYEDDEVVPSKKKFQQPADQFAVDANGRRRFHGAFTGGFSAGFGNSVGSQEGWTPTAFKSSRTEKAGAYGQKPEDFMDDEDRSEFGIAPRQMQTQNEFSGQKRPRQKQFYDGPIPGEPVLGQLVRAVHETAAVRMLRKMGWREEQGTGERITRDGKRRAREQHKVYGCYMPADMRPDSEMQSDEDSTGSEFDFDTLYAPDDYEPYILTRKNDRFGLGYSGLSRHSVLGNLVGQYDTEAGSSKSHLVMKEKGKKVSIRGHAFGVGALENDNDEDIYAIEDMSHYDFTLGAAADKQVKKPKEKGADALEGFARAAKPLPAVASYPAPALPRDYTPAAAGARRSRFEPSAHPQRDQGLGRHELTAEARGEMLGETPLPKTTQTDEQLPPPIEIPINKPDIKIIDFTVPITNLGADYISIKDSGQTLTKSFKPFVNDPQKQSRYEKYVQDKDKFVLERDSNMDRLSEWERNRELVEFEQAAKLYRPLTGEMGDRFTHAAEPDDGAVNPLCAVAKSSTNYGLASAEQIEAAARGAYGPPTRREAPWRPEALVCKRFNVPEIGGARPESRKEDKPKVSYSIFSYLESSVHDKESFAKEQSRFGGSKTLNRNDIPKTIVSNNTSAKNVAKNETVNEILKPIPSTSELDTGFTKRMTVAELFLKESEKDLKSKEQGVEVTETINKFDKMDLYKSIFLSDSENEELPPEEVKSSIDFEGLFAGPKNVERNLSPPRGIFANIDFDELNSWKRNVDVKKADSKITSETEARKEEEVKADTVAEEIEDDSNMYGPKIPENLKKRLEAPETEKESLDNFKPVFRSKGAKDDIQVINSSTDSDSWVDAKEVEKKKHKKKKSKKSKSKHKKSKHKKKVK